MAVDMFNEWRGSPACEAQNGLEDD